MSKGYAMSRGYVPTGWEDKVQEVSDKIDVKAWEREEASELFDELLPAARKRLLSDWEDEPTPGEKLFQKELDEIENERLRLMSEKAVGLAAEMERNAKIKAHEKRREELIARGPIEPEDRQSDAGLDPDWVRNADPMYQPKPSSVKPLTTTIRRRVSRDQIKAAASNRMKEHELASIAAAIKRTADQVERGRLLIRAQQKFTDHGEFLPWLATIPMPKTTAYTAMKAAKVTNR
jgi:hypothetical protein